MQNETLEGYLLSSQQQRLWQLRHRPDYRWECEVRLEGRCNVTALAAAVERVVSRHEILRTVFHASEDLGLTLQVINDGGAVGLEQVDFSHLPAERQETAVEERRQAEAARPFDYERGPLARFTLLKLSESLHLLSFSVASICADARTMQNIVEELRQHYGALAGGERHEGDEPAQYADYAAWQRELLESPAQDEPRAYWESQAEIPPVSLPLENEEGKRRQDARAGAVETYDLRVDDELAAGAERLATDMQVHLSDVLLAAWATLLWRLTGQRDVVVEVCFDGRKYDYLSDALGCFAQYLPVRCRFEDYRYDEVLVLIKDAVAAARARQEYYPDELRGRHDAQHGAGIGFEFHSRPRALQAAGLRLLPEAARGRGERHKLLLSCEGGGGELALRLEYEAGVYEREEVERLSGRLVALLAEAVRRPAAAAAALPVMGEAERRRVLRDWNDTAADFPSGLCVHQLFEQQAALTPDATALSFEGEHLSYAELNARADSLARRLRFLGVGPEVLVALLMERSTEMVVSLLAVLKAGGAYLPLDPSYPAERLCFMLEDAAAPVLLTQRHLLDTAPAHWGQTLCVDDDGQDEGAAVAEMAEVEVSPDNLAYVIYTSGSTGRPKGVMVTHRGLVNYLSWCLGYYPVGAGEGSLVHSAVAFDLTVTSIYVPLLSGKSIRLLADDSDVTAIARTWREHGQRPFSFIKLTPAHLQLLTAELSRDEAMPAGAHSLILGGENLLAAMTSFWRKNAPQTKLYNEYGPTETVVGCCIYEVNEEARESGSIPIGRPIANTQIYILDERLQPAPVGVAGELYIGGAGVARGYLSRPGLTAEKFIPHPFSNEPGARLYRTDDLARWLSSGQVEFLGRADHQVKIRGYRIEPGEVEATLVRHARVRECAVVARQEGTGERRLIAYVVAAEGGAAATAVELRSYMREQLPEYMVPSAFVMMEALPLTANGKLDRHALPAPEQAEAESRRAYVAPRSPAEDVLAGIWSQVLGVKQVSVDDNFFDLGGHSLLATQVLSRTRDVLQVELSLAQLFATPTVEALAEMVDRELRAEHLVEARPVVAASRKADLPLSFAQQRLWFIDQLVPGNAFYNIPLALRLTGSLSIDVLERTLTEIVRRHESLRTTFPEAEGQPRQFIHQPTPLKLEVEDLTGYDQPDEQSRQLAAEEARRPFKLSEGPLLRARLLKLSEQEHVALLTMHHIISDGWSMGVLVREVAALYAAYAKGEESPLEEPAVQYADYAVWQREWLSGEVLEGQLEYWRRQLGGELPALAMPTDHPHSTESQFRGATQQLAISRELTESLQKVSRQEGVTLFMTLLSAWQALLARYTGQEDITTGTPIANRNRIETENLIGFFVNTLVLRTDLSGDPSFAEILRRVREVCLGAYANQDVPFELLVEELQPERDLSRTPLFQTMLALQNAPQEQLQMPGLTLRSVGTSNETTKFDLTLSLAETEDGLSGSLEYNTDLYEPATIDRLLSHFLTLLRAAAADPRLRLSSLPLLSDDEQHRLLHRPATAANDAAATSEPLPTLHALFTRQAALTPHATALSFEGQHLSYAELNARADSLARRLRSLGVGPEVLVALLMERSTEMVVSLLAVLKAGGAYLPLDPSYPAERLRFMLEDAAAPVLLTQRHLLGTAPAHEGHTLCVDDRQTDDSLTDAEEQTAQASMAEATADNLAYVIYTSGSTGRPKGVMVTHSNVSRLLRATEPLFAFSPSDTWTLFHSYAFDFSVWELWGALCYGGRLVVVPYWVGRSPESFLSLLVRERVTVLNQTPSAFRQLMRAERERTAGSGEGGGLALRAVVFGGEALEVSALRGWVERHGDEQPRLVNMYGITETTVHVTYRQVREEDVRRGGASPIGEVLSDLRGYVLDGAGRVVPEGVAGELYVGGAGVTRGYLGRAGLTGERFVPDAFSGEEGARLYRTGDVVRRRGCGELEYVGRLDEQVKVRGYRIELGEVEARLSEHEGVGECVVVAREEAKGDKRLVAYIVPDKEYVRALVNQPLHRLPNDLSVFHLNKNETEHLYREIFHDRSYLKHGITLSDGDCVFDVGANIGLFTLFAAQRCKDLKVFAFEPSPVAFEKLRLNAERFGVEANLFDCGLSNRETTATFTYYPQASIMSGFYPSAVEEKELFRTFMLNQQHEGGDADKAILSEYADELVEGRFESQSFTCRLRTISDVIEEHGLERIDLLKVDVEKSEADVLEGISVEDWAKINQVVIEVHDIDGRLDRVLGLLRRHGFHIAQEVLAEGTGVYNIFARREARNGKPALGGNGNGTAKANGNGNGNGNAAAEQALRVVKHHTLSASDLRSYLKEKLPSYMVPSAFVMMEALPLTTNGKLDRRALPAPEQTRTGLGQEYVAPRTQTEELLANIWSLVLGVGQVGVQDNFFDLGGHSLLATQVVSRVREAFGADLPLRTLFITPTVAGLSAFIEEASRGGHRQEVPPVVPAERDAAPPLSFAQQRLWFISQLEPDSAAYNIPLALRLTGALDLPALERTLTEVVRRHESLRTTFSAEGGEPRQVIRPPYEVRVAAVDLRGLGEAERERRARELAEEEARRAFDLSEGPLLRVGLLKLAEQEHVALLTMHHIISDGWSMGVLVREVAALYGAFSRGEESPLEELRIQYADFAVWQQRWLSGETFERQLEYWKRQLADAPAVLELPTNRPRAALQTHRGALHKFALTAETVQGLRELSRREGATLYMTLLAAWQTLLSRYSGQTDISVGSPVANRNRAEIEDLIGFFVNTLVLRTDLSGDPTFTQLLKRVRETALSAYAHQDVPFERLVEELDPERSLSHSPLFQVMFILQNAPMGALELPGLTLSPVVNDNSTAKFDLTLTLEEVAEGISGGLEYDADLFDEATARRMVEGFQRLLEGVVSEPARRVSALPLLTAPEERLLLSEWNDTGDDYPRDAGAHVLFEAQASRTPEAAALVSGGRTMTYDELERGANSLARHLRALGVGPDVPVAILAERSPEMILGVLAILKAGGAYVPMDARYPAERLRFMLDDSRAPVLLTQQHLAERFAGHPVRVVCLDADREAFTRHDEGALSHATVAANLAYLIYTSGSTGRPKGVAMTHGALTNLLCWQVTRPNFRRGARTLQFTSLSFDVSFQEIFSTLCTGGVLVLIDEEARRDPAEMLRVIEREAVERLFLPFVALQHLAETAAAEGVNPSSLREVITAGEQLKITPDVEKFFGTPGHRTLHNHYGPSETHVVTAHDLEGASGEWPELPPIGAPLSNVTAYVLDAQMRPVPVGVRGELYIGGDALARGYHGRPGLTAEKFIPHPFSNEPGARLYRTDDLARWLSSGQVEFLGRADHQVKIRGYRIEPGEVEATLVRHARVRECAVVARQESTGERRLVAYVVAAEGGAAATAVELRSYMREQLPEYMVPSAFVMMEALPLTGSGKVDRRALPAPEQVEGEAAGAMGMTPVQELVAGVFAQVLGINHVGAGDSFFELGGHSLLATQVISRLREAFGVELALRHLFERPTVEGLSDAVEAALRGGRSLEAPPIKAAARDGALPLSFAQQRLWFIDQLEGGSGAYNIPLALRLHGELRHEVLERTLTEVVRRHESLRTTFVEVEGQPRQVIHEAGAVTIEVEDLTGCDQPEGRAQQLADEEARRPFDLSRGPLLRVRVLKLAEQEHVALLTMHHIISDGWSMGVLVNEVAALYAAYAKGEESPLEEPEIQYADYAVWQREWLSGEVLEGQLEYWRRQLGGELPVLELPTDRPRPAVQTYHGTQIPFALPDETTARLQALARREGVTLYMILLAAWQALLARYSGQEEIVVGTDIANRNRHEIESLVGFFVNQLVIRTDLSGDLSFTKLLKRVREVSLEAYAHQDAPFERLVEELQPQRDLSRTPLYQVKFVYQNTPLGTLELPGLTLSGMLSDNEAAKFDLTLTMNEADGHLSGELNYNTDLFESTTIARMIEHFSVLMQGVADDPQRRLSELPLMTEAERRRLVYDWNDTAAEYPRESCVHELFEAQASRTPEAVAVSDADGSVTYAELNERANRVAHYLLGLGVGPEMAVGICVERSVEMVVALLGVLKAGAAYLPLDPTYPQERIAFMIEDAGVNVLLSQERLSTALPVSNAWTIYLDAEWPAIAACAEHNPRAAVSSDNLAYVIYTSGSTGRPKGVQVNHASLVNLVTWHQRAYGLTPGDRATLLAGIAFDASVWEVWPYLCSGSSLHVAPEEARTAAPATVSWLAEQRISICFLPTPLAEASLQESWPTDTPLRFLLTGGDKLHRNAPPALGFSLVNHYGPTENTVVATCATVGSGGEPGVSPPIGGPITNTQIYILDRRGQPVPTGVPGELYIGGASLSRGYLSRPGLTAEKFIPHPFSNEPGARLYRTGDLARWLSSGQVEFLGRADHQVKIRGYRIEPGEVEATLVRHARVRECAVVARQEGTGERRLVAYVVAAEGGAAATAVELRSYMREQLPEYMVPSAFVMMEALPLTGSGKVDRRALPVPEQAEGEAAGAMGMTPVQELVAGVFAQVLGGRQVGLRESFFEVGGHSLLATQVISRLREAFGVELALRHLFERPTVEGLSDAVEAALRGGRSLEAPPIKAAARDGALPLSFAQQRLWFIDQLEGGSGAYNIPLALRLHGELRHEVLERTLTEVVRRHESLRTTFVEVEGQPRQVIHEAGAVTIEVEDLTGCDQPEEQARQLAVEEGRTPFDLMRGPLLRVRVLKLAEQEHVALLTMHHIISDGWSMGVLVREVAALYGAFSRGEESPLEEPEIQYADYAVWQREWLKGEVLEGQLEYWRRQLGGELPVLELPTDRPRPAVPSYKGAHHAFLLSPELSEAVKELSRQHDATLFMTLLAAWQALLARYSGQEEIVVGTDIANRNRAGSEGLIGFFINQLVMRTDLSGDPSFTTLLKRVREACLGAYAHQDVPFEKLVSELQPAREASRTPLYQVKFVLQNVPVDSLRLPGLEMSSLDVESGTAKFDLMLTVMDGPEQLGGSFEYRTDLFEPETLVRMQGHFEKLLQSIVAQPDAPLGTLDYLTDAEQRRRESRRKERDEANIKKLMSRSRKKV